MRVGHAEDITFFIQTLQDSRNCRILQVQIFLYISLAYFLFARAEKVIQHSALGRCNTDLFQTLVQILLIYIIDLFYQKPDGLTSLLHLRSSLFRTLFRSSRSTS